MTTTDPTPATPDDAAGRPQDAPLSDVVVVDLSQALAGPHATMILGDLGATVIKVERTVGDDSRHWGPPWIGDGAERVSTYFLSANRNKRSVVLDLKSEEGLATLRRLIAVADVLVENFRPGVLDRMGLTVEELHRINERLVVCSISGFGHDGPEGGRAGYDQIAQGESGLMSMTGPDPETPTKVGVPIGDMLAGLHAVYGILAALHARARTGRGDVVRTSLLSSLVGVHAYQATRYTVGGVVPHAQGNHHPSIAPYGAFACADGVVQIAAGNDELWRRTAAVAGVPADDPRFVTNGDRVTNRDALIELLEGAFADRARDELLAELDRAGVPSGAIRTMDEVFASEQLHSQGMVLDLEHPALGPMRLAGSPVRFGNHGRSEHLPPPTLGQDQEAVLAWLAEREQGQSTD